MDDQRVGRIVRALRRRLGWRQADLARRARCSQRTVSRAERGHLPTMPILRRLLDALDASITFNVWWRAGALDRLLDEHHAVLVGALSRVLAATGWLVQVEVTYSEFGERGSIDILAYWAPLAILLVIEVKTDLPAVDATLRKLDEKVRLGPKIARERFGWNVRHVARLLVLPESSTLRRRADRQAAVLGHAFPMRGPAIRKWLRDPSGTMAGLWFFSSSQPATRIQSSGGRERVRTPKAPPASHHRAA